MRQSRQALMESASLIGPIVTALATRIESSESVVKQMRTELQSHGERAAEVESHQASLESAHLRLLQHLQDLLSNDRRLISELERLKLRLTSTASQTQRIRAASPRVPTTFDAAVEEQDILSPLTETERQTIDLLGGEGPKTAPELGKRLKKSREHTARLLKNLYMEGYIDRESNRAPYRYKLNEKVRSALERSDGTAVTAKQMGKS